MSSFRTRSTCVLAPCTSVSQWPVLAVRRMQCCSCLVSQQLVRSFGEAAASQPTAPVLRSRLIDAVALRKKVGAAAGSALPMYHAGISTCCVAPRNVGLRCLSLTLGTACVSEYSALPCPTSSIDMARSGRRALSTGTPRLSCLARPQTPSSTRVAEQTRRLCSAAEHDQNVRISNAYFLLGLKPGVTKKAAKMRYYELAKQAHPGAPPTTRTSRPELAASRSASVCFFDDLVLAVAVRFVVVMSHRLRRQHIASGAIREQLALSGLRHGSDTKSWHEMHGTIFRRGRFA